MCNIFYVGEKVKSGKLLPKKDKINILESVVDIKSKKTENVLEIIFDVDKLKNAYFGIYKPQRLVLSFVISFRAR